MRTRLLFLFAAAILLTAGCASVRERNTDPAYAQPVRPGSVLRALRLDAALEERILALDPEHISEHDVRTTLAEGPTPRIMLLHGGIYPVHLAMTSFAKFLIGMGYPENRVRHPADGRYSESPYDSSRKLAGMIAWYYEREATRLMLIGHSQGGMQTVKLLDELAGEFNDRIPVWNPLRDEAEARSTIVDPLSGQERPVVGLSVAYASAVGAGGAALLLPNQWPMIGRLRTVPDTVDEFTGFAIDVDFFAWTFGGGEGTAFHNSGKAKVRNLVLPAEYLHVMAPATQSLARTRAMRDWLNAYVPDAQVDVATAPEGPHENLLWAADVWFSIKKHWCLEAQRVVRARRAQQAACSDSISKASPDCPESPRRP